MEFDEVEEKRWREIRLAEEEVFLMFADDVGAVAFRERWNGGFG